MAALARLTVCSRCVIWALCLTVFSSVAAAPLPTIQPRTAQPAAAVHMVMRMQLQALFNASVFASRVLAAARRPGTRTNGARQLQLSRQVGGSGYGNGGYGGAYSTAPARYGTQDTSKGRISKSQAKPWLANSGGFFGSSSDTVPGVPGGTTPGANSNSYTGWLSDGITSLRQRWNGGLNDQTYANPNPSSATLAAAPAVDNSWGAMLTSLVPSASSLTGVMDSLSSLEESLGIEGGSTQASLASVLSNSVEKYLPRPPDMSAAQTRRYDVFISKQMAGMIGQSAAVETMPPQEQARLAQRMALDAEGELMKILTEDQIKRWVESAAFGAMANLNVTQTQVGEALTQMQANIGDMQGVVSALSSGDKTQVSGFSAKNFQEFMQGG